jgi:hypothetical protein
MATSDTAATNRSAVKAFISDQLIGLGAEVTAVVTVSRLAGRHI